MSDTFKHKQQRRLKTKIIERRIELGGTVSTALGITSNESGDPLIGDCWHKFFNGSMRHGNKRRYEAYMKWKHRKAERYKLNKIEVEIDE